MKITNKIYSKSFIGICLLGTSVLQVLANSLPIDAANKGYKIVRESDDRDKGWLGSTVTMKMILSNKFGDSSERLVTIKMMEVAGDGDKSLTVFESPRDIKGTNFLTYSHSLDADDQWIFLPAVKRVKRIASKNKSGPFVGSEFAYEDIASFEVDKYDYLYLRDEKLDDVDCFLVEMQPKYEFSGYSKLTAWIDQSDLLIRKIDYYDRKEQKLKTQIFENYQKFSEKYFRPLKTTMVNHQTGKSTDLIWSDYQLGISFDESEFSKRALQISR